MTSTTHDGELIELEGNRVGVRFERRLAHPPERVWRAITDPEDLAAWFPDTIEGEFGQGAEVTFPKFVEMGLPSVGRVTEFDPPRLLAFTWGPSTLRFELEPDGDGCRLVFMDSLPREESAKNAAGWEVCLADLESRLDGEEAAGRSEGLWTELHEHYAERFDVDPEVGLRAMREYGKSA
ncbi:MAG TPA: SRPBCC family protein [Solirubrobacterales bacterium]|jgi:uncharacterized protein YndB with AHSA1/START domain